MKRFFSLLILALLILLVFWLGKQFGSRSTSQEVLSNSVVVREIAELASLEVQGVASIKRSNLENNGDWTDNLKKVFLENTVWVSIPYLAKYGVDVNDQNFRVSATANKISIRLPVPKLLSYELKVDRMETSNRKGWFLSQDDETYTDVQKKLYQTSRAQLESNAIYLQQSKDKIRKIITQYYQPFLKDHELEVVFEDGNVPELK
jgi:ribosomal protein L23